MDTALESIVLVIYFILDPDINKFPVEFWWE